MARLHQVITYVKTHKKQTTIGLGVALVILYGVMFFLPKQVQFSYAADATCARGLTLLPSLHAQSGTSDFAVTFQKEYKIGSFVVASGKTCFTAAKTPKASKHSVGVAPFGGIIARSHYNITVASPPRANVSSLDKPLPVSKPLIVPLSSSDEVFSYELGIGGKTVACESQAKALSCDVPGLELEQGKAYDASLMRSFAQSSSDVIAKKSIQTLSAVTVSKSTVTPGQTIYEKPTSFSFTTDKPLSKVKATLKQDGGSELVVETKVNGAEITVTFEQPLVREKAFSLVLSEAEARDGSTFVEPYAVNFKTSGGPKVTNVSVGSSRVPTTGRIVLTFDQAISNDANVKKFISLQGGTAIATRLNDTQVALDVGRLGLCQPFALIVAKGFTSKFETATTSDWRFGSRTICYTTSTYGTSLKGRPLTAYYFGTTGPVTMYVGAIHGNESSSSALMKAWIDELEANPTKIGNRRLVIVPTINPDGVAAGTRTNSRGVNLSRNFPTDNWVSDIDDTDGKHKGGGGAKPLSEPESAALARLTTSMSPRLLLSFHAVGSLVVGDPGGYSAGYAAQYAALAGYRNATGNSSTFDYNITGSYEDWSYRNAGIPSMVIELGSYSYASISNHRSALWAMLQ